MKKGRAEMSKKFYPAVMKLDEDGYYYVDFPDLECCFTQGNDFNDACFMAEDILGEWMSDHLEKDTTIPEPTSLLVLKEEHPNDIVQVFGYDDIEWKKKHSKKSVIKTVSIPEWLDKLASENKLSLSKVLQSALKERLGV